LRGIVEHEAVIAAEHPDQPEIRALVADLNRHLLSLYRPEDCYHLSIEELSRPEVTFFVARREEQAVGCGALRRLDATMGEVKRMYTAPEARGSGLGRRILQAIEAEARRSGLERLVLETGHRQPEALGLYRSAGFAECGAYLDYPDDGASIFMEKRLVPPTGLGS
jgi:putative acetyltransferase